MKLLEEAQMLKDLHITDCTEVQKIVELVLEIQRKSHSERIKNGIKLKKKLSENRIGGKINEKN